MIVVVDGYQRSKGRSTDNYMPNGHRGASEIDEAPNHIPDIFLAADNATAPVMPAVTFTTALGRQ